MNKPYNAEAQAAKNLRAAIEANRVDLINTAKSAGVGLVHIYDPEYPKGGLTIAFKKVSPYTSGVMVECSVSTCSQEDSFSKKIGTQNALTKFFQDDTFQLPLLLNSMPSDINGTVKRAFSALYEELL